MSTKRDDDSRSAMTPQEPMERSRTKREVLAGLGTWGAVVAAASASGIVAKLPARLVAPLVIGGIALPTLAYARSPELKALRSLPFKPRSVAFDGRRFWTADRNNHATVSFTL